MTTSLAEVFPAGEILADELDARGWTQTEFAQILGRPTQLVSEIIAGKKEITRESAAQIGAALGTSAELWLSLQDKYLLKRQTTDAGSRRQLDDVRLRAKLNDFGPISVMRHRGLLRGDTPQEIEREISDLYGIESLSEGPVLTFAARRTQGSEDLSSTQLAWVACVRRRSESVKPTGKLARKALEALGAQLTRTARTPSDFSKLPEALADVGVRLVYVEAFPSSKMDGCSLMHIDGSAIIGLSGRGKRFDKVLFTLLHEIAHLTLGHLNTIPLVVDDGGDISHASKIEKPADELASLWMVPGGLPSLPERITQGWIEEVAADRAVHPIVLIGRLQKLGHVPWKSTLVRDAPSVTSELEVW